MSIFAILDFEPEIQVNDKTRLNAGKSFASKAVHEINTLTVKPELSGSAIDIYAAGPADWYLDWSYGNTSIDVGTENDDLIFSEQGGADISTTLTAGTYTLSQYATHLAARMTAAGTQTYSGSVANGKITVSASGTFQFKASSVSAQSFFDLAVISASQTSSLVEYGNKIVTVVASNGTDTDTKTFYLKAYSEAGDYLFCSDGDLIAHEPDIMSWTQNGRSSFKNVYRRAQKLIIAWLDEKGYCNVYGDKYTKRDILDVEEVRQWATFMSLRLIFQGLSNAIDDVFDRKSKLYEASEIAARGRVILRLDTNKDGQIEDTEGLSIYSGSLFRR
jgi:hypothetical protein